MPSSLTEYELVVVFVLIARTTKFVIAWVWVPYESSEHWVELLSLIPSPVYVVCDGQKGMLHALKALWPLAGRAALPVPCLAKRQI
jgi:hypothetical protein